MHPRRCGDVAQNRSLAKQNRQHRTGGSIRPEGLNQITTWNEWIQITGILTELIRRSRIQSQSFT